MNRFENGFDSFEKAVNGLENRNPTEYALKDIIINFHHSIEVLFKHILYSKGKFLIYSEFDKWIDNCFNKKIKVDLDDNTHIDYTITFEETLRRIIVLCEVSIDKYTYDGFRQLCKLRNSIIHDEVKLIRDEVEQIFVSLITTVVGILGSYLPEEEKDLFINYVNSEKYSNIVKRLFKDNMRWRIITITNLLNLYMDKKFETLTQAQITNITRTLSVLGIYICEEYSSFLNIDNEYYISHISYLKQEICDLLLCYAEDSLKNNNILKLIKKNYIIQKVLEEYLKNAALYVYELIGNIENSFFDNNTEITNFFDTNSLTNNHDIYIILYCIYRITSVCVIVADEKRRENLLKRIYLDDEKTLPIQKIYSSLSEWYVKNGWYNSINIDNLDSLEKSVFGEDSENIIAYNKFCEDVVDGIYERELYHEILGEMGEWGTIDNVDEVLVEDLTTIIKDNNMYSVIFRVLFGTQTYFDHEYFDNGSKTYFIEVSGTIVNNEFVIKDMHNLGYTLGFRSFKFN